MINAKIKGMSNSNTHNERIAKMTFASVYPMYLSKVEKKGRTKEELHQVIEWLTGFDNKKLQELIKEKATFETFFQHESAGDTSSPTRAIKYCLTMSNNTPRMQTVRQS